MCCFFLGEKKPYFVILSDCFYIKFYVKGLGIKIEAFDSFLQG
jgi:hypothetical protein